MRNELEKCCEIILKLLEQLAHEGKITQEEYIKHSIEKTKFLRRQ